ncbi:peptide-methionine (S)-S-oxide reductase MsrA [Galactobacter caseinivorans]|nr:peptide-methionine (S)-S-oxide reductase MsrA [Galactobacter caseinivorans]
MSSPYPGVVRAGNRMSLAGVIDTVNAQIPTTFPGVQEQPETPTDPQILVVAGGCFWCLDAWYRTVRGVLHVESGYTGGHVEHPNYDSVSAGGTGHAEAVALVFDPAVISEDILLDMFFVMHDPTTLNRQGYDVGSQYRSALFPRSEEQVDSMKAAIERNQANWDAPIVTTIEPLADWTVAEPEHQDFYAKHPDAGYCQVIINPKMAKARKYFASWQVPA